MAEIVTLSSTKYRTLAAVLLISIAVIGGHLMPGLDNSRVEDGIRNGMHVVVFAAFAGIIFQFLKRSGIAIAAVTTILAAALVGALAESLQGFSGKALDVFDVARDLSGAALGLTASMLWHWSINDSGSKFKQGVLRSLSVLLGLSVLTPAAFWLSIIVLGRMTSPVILDFDQWWNKYIFRPINAEIVTPIGVTGSAEIELLKWRRSGLVISPMMTDWRDYEFLTITAGMASGPDTNVTVRINDSDRKNNWSDQFLASIVVDSTVSAIRIPLTELVDEPGYAAVDLSDIQELVIFARDRRRDTVLIIDDIRLE